MTEGMSLPEIKKSVIQRNINLYAEASRDFNPIHIDENFARQTPLGGTIAHGMLVLAYVSQMMTAAFGQSWLSNGKLNVRFKAPARPGDTLTVSGRISKIEKSADRTWFSCDVLCANQQGEPVITGEARVGVRNDGDSR
ncbi:MAG: MaoC family dehydratase [Chloroflexi bacterium]|nr:MaoC family dehydratase [Chloroflexota bacterium]MBI2979562.1 MaoC family dehydratase [Chloroflexota bacterium]